MIGIKKTKYILITSILFGIVLFPNSVNAEYKTSESNPVNYTNTCKNYLNITIDASEYFRKTGVSTNQVAGRTISMTCKGRCKYYIYYADYGNLEKLSSTEKTDDLDEDIDDSIKIKKKTFTDSDSWTLPAGKEALVVVISLNNRKCKTKDNKGNCTEWENPAKVAQKQVCDKDGKNCNWENVTYCAAKNSKGTCIKRENVTCPKGKFNTEDNPTAVDEVELKGNGASLFVQNPNESGLVQNLRNRNNADYGQACKNAYNGVYDSSDSNKVKKYSITNSQELANYRTYYYNKILQYCERTDFAFNLKSSQIKAISNNLLKVYYSSKNFDTDDFKDLDTVNTEIENLKGSIKSSNIITRKNNLQKTLKCNKTASTTTSEEYLYISEKESVKAELSTGSVTVCESRCYEHLTVQYDPPVTVKAGLCFQYKVTVKSVTECGINNNFDLNNISIPHECSPSPICSNDSSHTQAGPNEEFDSCVKECDGGKYSQNCLNSCYDEVYNKKTSTNKTVKKSNTIELNSAVNLLNNSKESFEVQKLASKTEYSEDYLKYYYKENNNKSCTTAKIIDYVNNNKSSELEECAEYFFQAKALNPYGTYNEGGTEWTPSSFIGNNGATTKETTYIPQQIGRASPFYLRSVEETVNLLKSLVVPSVKTDYWKKYNITTKGIKRQYSTRYQCSETCQFTGCSLGDVYTGAQYSANIKNDLEALANALTKCSATAACDKKEETTEYTIEIKNSTGEKTATTTLNETEGSYAQELDGDGDGIIDMFVPRTGDEKTTTGILGLCYDDRNTPHYQTTITYPGTWINLKTGKRSYTKETETSYRYKKNYYCTPYNQEEVNKEYWTWAILNNYSSSAKPTNFTPEYNIIAQLGKNDSKGTKGFGKYNWAINFQCFYAVGNYINSPPDVPNNPPTCEKCNCVYNTDQCNTNIRVVTSSNLFPTKDGKKTEDETEIPFNWSSEAKDNTITEAVNLKTKYGINPWEYKKDLESKAQNNQNAAYSGTPDYHVYLTKENIVNLKQYVEQNGYLTFSGSFNNPVEGVEGLYYYKSSLLDDTKYGTVTKNVNLGVNNN